MAAIGDIQDLAIANVYAASALEIAEAEKNADQVLAELTQLAELVRRTPDLAAFLSGPTLDPSVREQALERMFRGRCLNVVTNLLQILNRKGRLAVLCAVAESYRHAHEKLRGKIEVFVRSAVPLSDPQRDALRGWAQKYTGKIPDLMEESDPALLAGIVVQIEDEKFDMSAAQRLSGFKNKLLDRASREIHEGKTYVAAGG